MSDKPDVLIEVVGGVAYVNACRPGISVKIIDWDLEEAVCPWCLDRLSEEDGDMICAKCKILRDKMMEEENESRQADGAASGS